MQELLTGVPAPLSNQEYIKWYAYYRVKASREEAANKKANRGRSPGRRR